MAAILEVTEVEVEEVAGVEEATTKCQILGEVFAKSIGRTPNLNISRKTSMLKTSECQPALNLKSTNLDTSRKSRLGDFYDLSSFW